TGNVAWSRCCDTRRRKGETTGNTNIDLNWRASPRPYLRGTEGGTPSVYHFRGVNSVGIKSRIAAAGTKYLAISLPPPMNFRLIMPSKHLRLGSKTPDPEFPVVATSPIRV